MMKKISVTAAITGALMLPLFVFAVTVPSTAGPTTVTAFVDLFDKALGWFESIVWAIAIIMILVAAFQFLTAAGNEEKVTTARKSLIWGLVGVAVALFARTAATFVANLIGSGR